MRPLFNLCIVLLISVSIVNCESPSKDHNTLEMHFSDINNFWKAYEKIKPLTDHVERTKIIQKEYINKSSKGLKILIKKDDLTAGDYATFMKDTVFFNSIKKVTLNAEKDTLKIRNHLRAFEKLYPKAKFNDIYFVIGQFKRAGTVVDSTMIIQLEKNARSPHTESAFLFNQDQLDNFNNHESLIPLVIHEQVHVNQKNIDTRTLLSKSICEGSADFLMYLQTDQFPSSLIETYAYGEINESILWAKFKTDLDINYKYIKTDWFYNYHREDLPPDLGYFMGFKICEKYYNEALNKIEAIHFILDNSNSEKLLELSQYNGGL
jgi:uncharacterized protein YjaZ